MLALAGFLWDIRFPPAFCIVCYVDVWTPLEIRVILGLCLNKVYHNIIKSMFGPQVLNRKIPMPKAGEKMQTFPRNKSQNCIKNVNLLQIFRIFCKKKTEILI